MSQNRQGTPSVTATCLVLSSFFFLLILPAQPQDIVSYSFSSFFLSFFTLPVTPAGSCFLLVSSFFLSLPCRRSRRVLYCSDYTNYSGNTPFSHASLHAISTKLGQNDQYLNHYSHTDNGGVKGHGDVTVVKKGDFNGKCFCSFRLHDMVMWLKYVDQLDILYKSYYFVL